MDFEFVRHDPVYDRMIFVLTLDRQKMKERILVGEEQEIRFRLQGKKISHRRSGENVCGVPYLERIFAGKAPTGKGGSL